MERKCGKCWSVNANALGGPTEACPACGAIYAKVEHLAALRAAAPKEDPKAAAHRAKKEADAAWAIEAEEIRQKARQDVEAEKLARKAAKALGPPIPSVGSAPPSGFVCTQCGHVGNRSSAVRGSFALELALWVIGFLTLVIGIGALILIIALIYSIWRIFSRRKVCRSCGSEALIPANSPRGMVIISDLRRAHDNIP